MREPCSHCIYPRISLTKESGGGEQDDPRHFFVHQSDLLLNPDAIARRTFVMLQISDANLAIVLLVQLRYIRVQTMLPFRFNAVIPSGSTYESLSAARLSAEILAVSGMDTQLFLNIPGVKRPVLAQYSDAYITADQSYELIARCAAEMGDTFAGMHLAKRLSATAFGPVSLSLMS